MKLFYYHILFITLIYTCQGYIQTKYNHKINYDSINFNYNEQSTFILFSSSIDNTNQPYNLNSRGSKDQYISKSKHKAKNYGYNHKDRSRQLDKVLSVIRDIDVKGSNDYIPTITEVNHAITTAGRLDRVDDAMEIFDSISKLRLIADLMSYNNIIWCTGNARRTEISRKIYNDLLTKTNLKPNVYTYGALMHGFAKTKNYKLALQTLDEMTKRGVRSNQIVISSAMEACAESGQHKEALSLLDRIETLGLKPDITMINTAIKACSIAGAMDEAEALAQSLRDYGSMDLFTYHTLMMGNTKLGRYQRVLSLYEEAKESSAVLDGGSY